MPLNTLKANPHLLKDILPKVSRSFYLTLRVLPIELREPIALAYLLARVSDTVADSTVIPYQGRLDWLKSLGQAILTPGQALPAADFMAHDHLGERALLQALPTLIQCLWSLEASDRQLVQQVLATIFQGQTEDLLRFPIQSDGEVRSLDLLEETQAYTYQVAGCVGAFWTRMCLRHVPGSASLDSGQLESLGVRFGQGLQWVNILRDFQKDLKLGRCYLPAAQWEVTGWKPNQPELSMPAAMKPIWQGWVLEALESLEDGWCYLQALPSGWYRIRLACAWPLLLGMMTLEQLISPPAADQPPPKVTRWQVYEILIRTILSLPSPGVWDRLFLPRARQLRVALLGEGRPD